MKHARGAGTLGAFVTVLALMIAACGGDTTSSTQSPTTTVAEPSDETTTSATETTEPADTTETTETMDAEACDAGGIRLASIPHYQGAFTQLINDGAALAVAQCEGVELTTAGPQAIDGPAHVAIFGDVLATDIDGVVTVAYPADLWVEPISEASEDGVLVTTVDVASPDSPQLVHSGPRQIDLGRAMGNKLVELLGADAEGSFVIGICLPGLDVLENRVTGVREVLEAEVPGLEIVGPFDTTIDAGQNFSTWERLTETNPDALGYIGVCDFDGSSLTKVKEANPDLGIGASMGLPPDALEGIEDGTLDFVVGERPFMMGYSSTRVLIEALNGADVPSGWIDSGNEVIDGSNVTETIARETAISEDPAVGLEYYQEDIDAIFNDLTASIRPFDEYLSLD